MDQPFESRGRARLARLDRHARRGLRIRDHPTGQRWEGHDGARTFYTTFLGAFPDVHFDLQDIVIGPQGVIEIAIMTGTHQGTWAGIEATGKPVRLHHHPFPLEPCRQEVRGREHLLRPLRAGGTGEGVGIFF
ncbi:MAG: ester cyclase [Anaerolineae bacterium]